MRWRRAPRVRWRASTPVERSNDACGVSVEWEGEVDVLPNVSPWDSWRRVSGRGTLWQSWDLPLTMRRRFAKTVMAQEDPTPYQRSPGPIALTEQGDDARALDDMFSAAYEELRRLAAVVSRDDPSET